METARIRKWLKARIEDSSEITALTGTRVYPVMIPQELNVWPAVAYFTQIEDATVSKDFGTVDKVTVQFNIVSPKLLDCENVESALRKVFDNSGGTYDGFTVQEARFVGSRDMVAERIELPVIEVTYQFRMYRKE